MDPVIITCALTGILTNPSDHPVPVNAEQMALEAERAYNAGASIVHVHIRDQRPGKGHLPCWDPDVAKNICDEIGRASCRERV